jgi:hypothetical protein
LGASVTITPIVDNIELDSEAQSGMLSTDQKQTLNFFFLQETVGTDIGFIIEGIGGAPFELTGPDYGKAVSEEMPAPAEFLLIPPNDFGTPNRKRATSIKFELNTRGQSVSFIPRVDQVNYPEMDCNSGEDKKKIFEYFFDPALGDFTWFMLGGAFSARTPTPFELYGGLTPQNFEPFPPRLRSLYIAENNYGAAARNFLSLSIQMDLMLLISHMSIMWLTLLLFSILQRKQLFITSLLLTLSVLIMLGFCLDLNPLNFTKWHPRLALKFSLFRKNMISLVLCVLIKLENYSLYGFELFWLAPQQLFLSLSLVTIKKWIQLTTERRNIQEISR